MIQNKKIKKENTKNDRTKYFKIVFVLLSVFFINGCDTLHKYKLISIDICEVKRNDIVEKKVKRTVPLFHRYGSYASDGILAKNIYFLHQDTISKRPFNSKELKLIKKQVLSDTVISYKRHKDITIYNGIYQEEYYGGIINGSNLATVDKLNCTFYNFVIINNWNILIFPAIKLDDTIYINGINNVKKTEEKIQYVESKLMQQFDSISVKEAIKEFSKGRKIITRKIVDYRML